MEENLYGLSSAMNSLDPVFTINEQFIEILKQHNFDGNSKQVIR